MRLRSGVLLIIGVTLFAAAAGAHSASDAYLTLTVADGGSPESVVVHGQWDIALRDLDFALHLDDDGDGHLTWGEVRRHQSQIERYAYAKLYFNGKPAPCTIKPGRQLIDDHADGAYAALFFDVVCPRSAKLLTLKYDLFFAQDPSHRGIVVMRAGANVATAVLAPQNSTIHLPLE